jgi:hypothetical protein
MDDFYCGEQKGSGRRIGSNYECMRKGIGVGSRIKLPRGYRPETIDPRAHLYCGGKNKAPVGKHKGNPLQCFRKGFGIGKKVQYGFDNIPSSFPTWLCSIIIGLITFGLMFAFTSCLLVSLGIGVLAASVCWLVIIG